MKFGKVKVGMRVRISSNPNGNSFESLVHGQVGVVSDKEDAHYNHVFWDGRRRSLSCAVEFNDGTFDWGSHLNLEEVKDEA
ncbi:hypothetical protein HOU31_gp14 [Acinetobacter phage vB_AbaP_46-62_Aci07]|uniref:Uncharacterized protein n=1 Tax=Acinetobacter phage vB_AbaP_46-62_Aci07 TaxID=2315468 RepID=A0A386KLF5_9CAUD|nr:hypothetical protein HOU31_gp14 [Acinetobacter phage vB_AbaP_46-62_Aci07]AYD85894.1 hypothetical protein Aci07_14 [Acinetobacter phage vB_AbaP_46-62_Aci07]